MAFFSWSRWFRSLLRPKVKPIRKRASALRLEELETRLAPATFTWDGLGADNKWMTGANWVGGAPPTATAASLDDLVFQGTNQLASVNNFPAGATFNSITFSSAGFSLSGDAITLGSTAAAGSGRISVNNGLIGESIAFDINLGGAGSSGQQVFTINPAAVLTIGTAAGGKLSGAAGVGLTEQGGGTLILGQDNSGLLGAFTVATGSIVEITNKNGLGATNTTTIQQNAQLQVNNVGTVTENLKVSGSGVNGQGVIISTGPALSTDTLTGSVEIDSPVTFGGAAGTTLIFGGTAGQITDLGAGYTITKEGQNTVVFGTSNSYRGETVINNGVLEVQNSGSVGTNRITINTATLETGTLAIFDPLWTGIPTPTDKGITLTSQIQANGAGFGGDGAVWNMQGRNTLTGQFILGTNRVFINTDVSGLGLIDSLTISGPVTDAGTGFTKIGTGELILTDSNPFTGGALVAAGILDITDSQALGPKATAGTTTVQAGATLQLDVDNNVDSLTTTTNTLNVYTTLRLSGTGSNGEGALYSATGINIYYGQINLIADANLDAVGLGVNPDPNQVNGTAYFTSEYSLTLASTTGLGNGPLVGGTQAVKAVVAGGGSGYNVGDLLDVQGGIFTTPARLQVTSVGAGGAVTSVIITQQDGDYQALPVNPTNPLGVKDISNAGAVGASFNITWGGITIDKLGFGQLILPQANAGFTGNVTAPAPGNLGWDIQQGWVTIENNQSLGAILTNMSQSNQMMVAVESDASLHLKALPGQNLNIDQNLRLVGAGISHPFGLITEGALENVQGVNTLDGNVVLEGPVGVGVENVFGQPSQLTTIGTISQQFPATISAGGAASSGAPRTIPLTVGATGASGPAITMTIKSDVTPTPNDLRVYLGGSGALSASGQPIPGVTGTLVYDNSLTPYPVAGWGTPSNKYPQNEATITITYTSTTATVSVVEAPFNAADPAGTNYNPNFVNGSTTISYPALTGTSDAVVMNQVVNGVGNADGSGGWTENISVGPLNVPGSLVKLGSGLLDIQGQGTYQGGTDIQQGVVINQNNTGLGVSGTPSTPSTVTVESGAALALANGTAYNNGGLNSGIAVNNTHLVIKGSPEVQAITVGGATAGTFQVTFNGQTTGALSATIPASGGVGPTASLQNALNALSSIGGAGGSVAVTLSGGVYTVTFGGKLANFNQTQMSAVGAGGTTASVSTITDGLGNTTLGVPLAPFSVLSSDTSVWSPGVTLVQSSPFLQALAPAGSNTIIPSDAVWNGPISLNVSTPIDVSPGSRLQITGAIDDTANTLGSDLIAMDTGELVLSGVNTYKGTTYVGTNATAGAPGNDPDAVNEFFNPASPTALGNTVLTVANGQALGATTNGTIVQGGSSLQLEGNITISGESLTVQGSGVGSASGIENWVQVGPAPIAGGQTLGTVPAAVSGIVTGIAVDQTDVNTVYISTNGGGVWKTTDGGTSWLPIFDNTSTASNLFVGSVAVSASNPQVVYLGTGVSNGAFGEPVGSYGGDGVYKSQDGGHSWALVTGPAAEVGGTNPLLGLSVSKIVVDPKNPSLIYVATGDQGYNGSVTAVAGIWRYDGTNWLNLTAQTSPNRQNVVGKVQATPPKTPGPDDNYLYNFPQTKVTWSDLVLVGSGANATLFAALGTPGGTSVTNYGVTNNANSVYFTVNPTAAGNAIVWDMGDGITDGETAKIDDNSVLSPTGSAGNIKLTSTQYYGAFESFAFGNPTVYIAIANDGNGTLNGVFQGKVAGGGGGSLPFGDQFNYAAVSPPAAVTATDTQDNYDLAIYTPANGNGSNVYVGTQNNLQWTSNSGGAWNDITVDTSAAKNAPHADFLALAGYSLFAGAPAAATSSAVFAGTDGGIWNLNTLANVNTWSDLNAGLAISQINSVSENSTSATASYVATQATGIAQNTANSTTWSVATNNGGASLYGAGVVVDPNNPLNVYAFVTNSEVNFPGGAVVKTSPLLKSTNGGTSFAPTGLSIVAMQQPALAIDTVVSSRLVVGAVLPNTPLQESLDGGNSFRNIGTRLPNGFGVTEVGLAEYQGPFVSDASFGSLTDQGSSSYVPGTFYVTNSRIGVSQPTVELTRDYGNTWVNRTPVQFATVPFYQISDLVVDPTNSNTVYITLNVFGGSSFGNVYKSINGGQSWIDITGNLTAGLPAGLPTWTLTVDPRENVIYVGTDNGVWARPSTGGQWQRIGNGMPNVQIKDLHLDPATNILYAGTYGRSEYQLLLNGTQANGGALTVVSGSAFWTGPIYLSGATTIGADGGATYQRNGINTATLTISGTISDLTAASGAADTITKVGTGNVVLSGTNTYLGVTDIQQGVLIVNNPNALGGTSNGTVVEAGTALQMLQSIAGEPLTLNGNGPAAGFNGHFTGALESINNSLTYSGNITLGSDVTIGTDSGSTLTITGNITGGFGITKELTGTLAFEPTTANTYTGSTSVLQGVLLIEGSQALANSSGTFVVDGAQLQLMSPDGVTPVIITGETLDLTGAGISGGGSEGALLNISGNNAWDGPVTLDYNPGFSPTTFPVGAGSKNEPAGAAIGVLNATDVLTIGGAVGEAAGLPSQLIKVGAGTLALAGTNTYTGGTVVSSGAVTVQNAQGLGNPAPTVNHLYAIDRSTLYSPNGTGTMTYSLYGQTTPSVTIAVSAGTLQGYLDAILASEFGSNALANVTVTKTIVNVPLTAGTPTPSFTEAVFSFLFGGTAMAGLTTPTVLGLTGIAGLFHNEAQVVDGGTGVVVASGAALNIDLAASPNGQTVTGEPAHISGTGINQAGAIDNLSGTNTWAAEVTLDKASSIGVSGGSLAVQGDVAGTPTAHLTKVGTGTLFFPNANDYGGTTEIQNGVLNIANPAALGLPSEIQTITLTGMLSGTFQVSFNLNGNIQQTGPLAANISALNLQNALDALSNIGGVGGSVTVLKVGNVYTVTFGGTLAGMNLNQMTAIGAGGAVATVATVTDGGPITSEVDAVTINGATTGSFTLTFQGQTTGNLVANDPNLVADMTAALNGLSTIGGVGAFVTVAQTVNVYNVTFGGSLAGQNLNGELSATVTTGGGTMVVVSETTPGGLGATVVDNGGTLQLQGGITVTTEPLTLSGPGYNGMGALDSLSGANTWANPIALAASSAIGVDADAGATPGLTINQVISGAAAGTNLTKVGVATLNLTATNTYNGATFVNDGTLLLNDNGGMAVPGDITVGDGVGAANSAVAQWLFNGEIPTTANVTVNSDGKFDLNSHTQTINNLKITDGTAQTGKSGTLTLSSLGMTGGVLNTGTTGQVNLNGDVLATSDAATGAATISGTGGLALGSVVRTFNVTAGPATPPAVDLDVQVPVTAAGNPGILKTGNGRLELDAVNAFGLTTVMGGDVEVNGTVGDVVLNGGNVSGAGTDLTHGQVGNIGGPAGGIPKGTISPGDNGAINPIGTLTVTPPSGTETWGAATGFAVDLNDATAAPGVGADLLLVNGNLNLGGIQIAGGGGNNGGALLSGTVSGNVSVGDSFTIIETTGTISGVFQEPFLNNTVFIGGDKFTVAYNSQSVVLTRQINNTTMAVVSSANPSVYGQDVKFTATLTGEPGAVAPFLSTDQIKFTLHTPSSGDIVDIENVVNGKATFDALANGPLPPGTYLLDAAFSGDQNYGPASVTGFQQNINPAVTTTTLTPSPTNPVAGQTLTIYATVAPKAPGAGIPTGTVTFAVDGGAANAANGGFTQSVSFDASFGGVVPLSVNGLTVGTHTFAASYSGDANFKASNTAFPALSVTVTKDSDTMQLSAAPAGSAVIGQQVTFTASVTTNGPGTVVPSGTVNFLDGSKQIGTGTLAFDNATGGYDVSMQTSTLTLGKHTITAQYLGSAQEMANQVVTSYTIAQIGTTTSISSSTGSNPAVYGQSVTFTATVAAVAPGTGVPTGTVTFKDGSITISTASLNGSGVATVTTTTLSQGNHTITATYNGATTYAGSSASVAQQVQFSSATSITSSANPSVYQANVTFTAKVTPGVGMPPGTPTGQVNFVIDGSIANTTSLSGGQASYTAANLAPGTHTVVVEYLGSTSYGSSNSGTLTQNVQSGSTVSVVRTAGSNPSVAGQPITFQAQITATAPGAPTPTGTVTFFDGSTNLGTQPVSAGVANLTISTLSVGVHSINATYNGDAVTAKSSSTTPVTQQVTQATAGANVTSSVNPSSVNQAVTFTATVTASGNPVTSGNVTFLFDGGSANAANGGFQYTTALSNGQASYLVTALTKGSHTVVVKYTDPSGNYTNATSPTLTQNVLYATAIASFTSSANPASEGSPVTLTASVSTSGVGTVTGTVDFVDTTTSTDLGTGTISAGRASISTSFSSLGTHALTATYSGDTNFDTSSGALNQQVRATVNVSLLLTSGNNPSVYTEPVTFQATVTPQAGGSPTPTGTVSFFSGTTLLTTVNLPAGSNQVSATINNIPAGTDSITATYSGDSNFGGNVSPAVSQNVSVDPTTTAVASSAPTSTFGQSVTFTASVAPTGNATGVPQGTVTFLFDGGSANAGNGGFQQTVALTNGKATYATSALTPSASPHSVQANYNGDPNGFGTSSGALAGGQTVQNSTNPAFSYDAGTKTLTVTGNNFTFAQATTDDAGGNLHSTYFFTMDGTTESFADTVVTHAVINGHGTAGKAILITNDTYVDNHGVTQETPETISLGSKSDAGVGSMLKYNGTSPYTFLTLSNFPVSYAYVGRNDGTVSLYGSASVAYNGFVSAGNYSYIGGPGLYHEAQGASSVYGYSSGQASDFAYHYAANAGSQFVVSGTAFSYMSCTDQNPSNNNATQSFFNVGVGFLQNTGVAKNPGQDYAYFIDSPGNDTFVGGTAYSYMYIPAPPSPYAEFDVAYGFALVYAQSFVGGTDTAVDNDPSHNIIAGFNSNNNTGGGNGRTGT